MAEVKVPFYGHVLQYHNVKRELDEAIHKVLESGNYVMGPALKQFETDFAKYFGAKHAVGVANGTDALWLTFMALGLKPGDEVITTANTFFATAEGIWIAGGKTVLVDCDPKTKNIDPAQVEKAITPRTKGIVPVHLYGLTADMPAISAIAKKHNLWVVEDNAQGIDGYGKGFKQSELADAVCTSFIIQKNLGTFGDRRREIAARYTKGLRGTSFALPYEPEGYRHAYHLYVIETPKRTEAERWLLERGVDVKLHYPIAIHQQSGFPWGKLAEVKPVPNCEANAAQCISLPMFPELTNEQADYTIEQCVEWDKRAR